MLRRELTLVEAQAALINNSARLSQIHELMVPNMSNELFLRLKACVDSIPMVDIHSHIDGQHPNAGDAKQVIFYHYVVTELVSAGAPPDIFSPRLSAEETLKKAVPWLSLTRNTSTSWCLMYMLRELYGFNDEEINAKNCKTLLNAISNQTNQKDWYKRILMDKAKIKKTFLTFNYDAEIQKYDPQLFTGALRVDPLVGKLNRKTVEGLEKITDDSIKSINDFDNCLALLLKKSKGKCATVTASLVPDQAFVKTSKAKVKTSFKKLLSGRNVNSSEKQMVSSFALERLLDLAKEFHFPFQMMLGVRRPVLGASPPDCAISGFEPKMIFSLCHLFHNFNEVKFDIILSNMVHSHELTTVAKNYSNVHVSGYWWYVFYPVYIRQLLRERIQMLPRNKMNGFFSDAYVTEWSFAKSCLVRLQLTTVLTEMVREGYLTENLAKELAIDLLSRNAERLYKLA
jgi:glucuronate isomerase